MALRDTIFPTLQKIFVQFNKAHKNTDMSAKEISDLVGKRSSDSCRDFTDGATTIHLVKQTALK